MNKTRIFAVFVLIGLLGVLIFRVIGLQLAIVIILGVGGWFIYQYNALQSLSQEIQESHSNIQISMKKRLDLANKLLEIASNYADHETMTQLGIAKLEAAPSPDGFTNPKYGIVENFTLMARNYPELQANQTYQILMKQLEDIEGDLQKKRETYNTKVRTYNTNRTTIPMVFLSDQIGFQVAPYFDAVTADAIEGLKDFKTVDGEQLKTFLSDLGNQVVERSESLTSGIEKVARGYLDNSTSDDSGNTAAAPKSSQQGTEGDQIS